MQSAKQIVKSNMIKLCILDSQGPVRILETAPWGEQVEAFATKSYAQAHAEGYLIDISRRVAYKHPSFLKTIPKNRYFVDYRFYARDSSNLPEEEVN